MQAVKFWLTFVGALLLALIVIGFGWQRSSLPVIEGTFAVDGPSDTIIIARDANGVPHIDAASENDLSFGLGYVHAQDRLWQMEMNRRIGNGRVAEVLGQAGVGFDKYFRTLGFTLRAETALASLPPEIVENLEQYAAGVNAYVTGHRGALPPEFNLIALLRSHGDHATRWCGKK